MKLHGVRGREPIDLAALKAWVAGVMPADMTKADIAALIRVTPKTVYSLTNPDDPNFGQGQTLIQYLQLAGALRDAPEGSPATSRLLSLQEALAGLEAKMDQRVDDVQAALAAIAAAIARIEDQLDTGGGQRRKGRP